MWIFASNLFHLFLSCKIYKQKCRLQLSSGVNFKPKKKTNLHKSWRAIFLIQNYLHAIIKRYMNYFDILKIEYDVATILENLYEQILSLPNLVFKWILILVMTHANKYAFKYRIKEKDNFLLYNNVGFLFGKLYFNYLFNIIFFRCMCL